MTGASNRGKRPRWGNRGGICHLMRYIGADKNVTCNYTSVHTLLVDCKRRRGEGMVMAE